MIPQRSLYDQLGRFPRLWWRVKTACLYRFVFGSLGKSCEIRTPLMLSRPHRMFFGDRVFVREGARLEVLIRGATSAPELRIGNGVNLEQHVHIVAQNRIVIGDNVSIGAFTMITDVDHPYADVDTPGRVGDRFRDDGATVEIGEGSFIGIGSSVLPGVRIGRRCMVGTRSVVRGVLPDYSVAVGAPARIVKRYDMAARAWRATHADGSFKAG